MVLLYGWGNVFWVDPVKMWWWCGGLGGAEVDLGGAEVAIHAIQVDSLG